MLNLITDAWLPVRRQHSGRVIIAPSAITQDLEHDPVIAIDWPRPDFRIATIEFLIGLLATACPPEDEAAWLDLWETPPAPEALDAAFAPLVHAFNLDGDGPRFLQDAEDLLSDGLPAERLLIDTPGKSTVEQNTDLLVHRGRAAQLSRPAAAIALYTLQAWAPEGGSGVLTGLRGGGPLTTLIAPPGERTLWRLIWANTQCRSGTKPDWGAKIFPWLAPTLTAENGRIVTPLASDPMQCWWGMPRRIRLNFTEVPGGGICDLTGAFDTIMVRSWRHRPRGVKYDAWGRVHPLSPHRVEKNGGEWRSEHPQPGGIGYRHWLGLIMRSPDGRRLPAKSVSDWRETRQLDAGPGRSRLIAAGYDMKQMKARGFVESEMPLPAAADKATRDLLDEVAARLIGAADQASRLLRQAVRNALFSTGATVKLDAELLSAARERLWDATEAGFYAALERVAKAGLSARDTALAEWPRLLHGFALPLFDELAPITPDSFTTAPRISKARRNLHFALLGFGKDGAALFDGLGLPPAEPRAKTKGKAA